MLYRFMGKIMFLEILSDYDVLIKVKGYISFVYV